MKNSACLGVAFKQPGDKDAFFPGRGETSEEAISRYCFQCKVRNECNDFADRTRAKSGIWGGVRRTRESHGNEKK